MAAALTALPVHALQYDLDGAQGDRLEHHEVAVVADAADAAAGRTCGAGADDARKPDNSIRAMTSAVVVEFRHAGSRTTGRTDEVEVEQIRCCLLRGRALGHERDAEQHVPCQPYWLLPVQRQAVVSICCADFGTRFSLESR